MNIQTICNVFTSNSVYRVLLIASLLVVGLQYYDNDLVHRYLQEKSSNDVADNSKMPKVLFYITTHMSHQHKEHLKHCWPLALKNSYLLNSSDIKVFLTPKYPAIKESIRILNETFSGMNLTYHLEHNRGYHRSAVDAMYQAARNGWFNGYDWVFRMNPDVIIQDDTWMLDTIKNDAGARLLYIECEPDRNPIYGNARKVHTDFFGLKLSALPEGRLLSTNGEAEDIFSRQVAPIIMNGQHRHIPDSYPLINGYCRVNGNPESPVFHFDDDYNWTVHVENGVCPAIFHNLDKSM